MRRRTLCAAAVLACCAWWTYGAIAGEGQGKLTGEVRIEGVDLGTYWYGAKIDKKDLLGKVVLIEQWGS